MTENCNNFKQKYWRIITSSQNTIWKFLNYPFKMLAKSKKKKKKVPNLDSNESGSIKVCVPTYNTSEQFDQK